MKSFIRHIILFLALSVAFGIAVAQQPEAASAPHAAQTQAEPQKPEAAGQMSPEEKQSGSEAQVGNKQGIAKEEESEEENAALKYSPTVTKVGKLIGLGPKASYWLFTCLNFAVVLWLVGWFLKAKVAPGLRERNVSIRSAMDAAKKASDEANARLANIEARLAKIDGEVAGLKAQAETDFKVEEQRIQQQAVEDAKRVVEAAEQEIASAAKSARRELKVFAADLAVGLAEKKISVDRDTDESLVRSFVDQLGKDGE
ncbi:MAG: ATP synthase F0 subunit B [Terriglobia bacterium]|jgi:F-type H+-transporting ATPase subunit b|nr:ATP synthase F0 subunit B [Terriglobia bacterium]